MSYTPIQPDPNPLTLTTASPVTAGQALTVTSTGAVTPATSRDICIGIAGEDDPTGGNAIPVHRTGVFTLPAVGEIHAGRPVITCGAGQVSAASSVLPAQLLAGQLERHVGIALNTASSGAVMVAVRLS